ncbi:MAG: helix-turn-helix domain-containing protein, partial [Nocardioides sp.]|uniref:helix-turn-helix domain-containing protein n=1 Tax=Nocardioides sp. TaxID=35761 RepID=UPI003D6B8736
MNNEAPPSRADRGARIDRRMRVLGVSQRQLAEHLGMSRTTVGKAVDGDEGVLERNLKKIESGLAE